MDFALDDDQAALQSVLREFLTDRSPEAAVRAQMEDPAGYDRDLWDRMAGELGLRALRSPRSTAAAGFSFLELGLVLEEMGRALTVSPFFASCVMAAQLLLALDDESARKDFLPGIAAGAVIASVALAEDSGSWRPEDVTAGADERDGAWRLDGHKSFVLDGVVADLLLVIARTDDGPAVFAVDAAADGLAREPLPTMDQTRKQARVTFAARRPACSALSPAPAAIATCSTGPRSPSPPRRSAAPARCWTCRSSTRRSASSSVAPSAPSRRSSTSARRCWWTSSPPGQRCTTRCGPCRPAIPTRVVAPLVKAYCVDTYLHAAGENIQIHGGIGFTWEHPAHLYLKRAKSSQVLLGDSDLHRQLLADRIGI